MERSRQQLPAASLDIRCQSGSFATASFRMSASGQPAIQQSRHHLVDQALPWHMHTCMAASACQHDESISTKLSDRCLRCACMRSEGTGRRKARQAAQLEFLHTQGRGPVLELAAAPPSGGTAQEVTLGKLLVRRPVAAIALVPKSAVLFAAGAVAGALGARVLSFTCPRHPAYETRMLPHACAHIPSAVEAPATAHHFLIALLVLQPLPNLQMHSWLDKKRLWLRRGRLPQGRR